MDDPYEPSSAPRGDVPEKSIAEPLRLTFMLVDGIAGCSLLWVSVSSGLTMWRFGRDRMGDSSIGWYVAGMYALPGLFAFLSLVFLWRRWRFRWLLQLTLGLLAIAGALFIFVVPLFVDVQRYMREATSEVDRADAPSEVN